MQLFKTIFIVLLLISVGYDQAWAIQTCGDKGTCQCSLKLDDKNINFKFNPLMNTAHEAVFHVSITCVLHQKGSEEVDYKIHFASGHSDNIKYRHMCQSSP